jgi:hypothetical protein
VGIAAPARIGLTVVKAARKTGRLGSRMATWIGRSLREVVDGAALRRAVTSASITQPGVAVRGARQAVKLEKGRDLLRLVGDVGRVQSRAGTQAALDGLKLAEGPRDMSRIARLAATKGGKTRAILKLAGRGALLLTIGTFNLAMWVFWAALTILGFVTSLKRTAERMTERYCVRRKLRRARERERCEREQRAAALAASAPEPTLIYSNAPSLVPTLKRPNPIPPPHAGEGREGVSDIPRPPWHALAPPRQPAGEFGNRAREKSAPLLRVARARSA